MVTKELEKQEFEKVDQIVERYADEDGALIQVLLDAQHEYSWLSKDVLMRISERMEIPVSYITTIPGDLQLYEIVFVCLGVFDNAYALNITEGLELASYLDNGGRLYMEGGDTWYFDEEAR